MTPSPDLLVRAIQNLLRELVQGAETEVAWILNPSDPGLLRSLERLSAAEASAPGANGSSIAAHVEHLRYGIELLNRSASGGNPFADADWGRAWTMNAVDEQEWANRRAELERQADEWRDNLGGLIDAGEIELTGVLASFAHLAYHLGAIRQMNSAIRGTRHADAT